MKVKEVYVSITQAERIFEVIEQSLIETKDVQIFVAEALINELRRNVKHHVYEFNGPGCYHYNKDDDGFGEETWYSYNTDHAFSQTISLASFISNCEGYYQLVEFPKNKSTNNKLESSYTHYLRGFKELLLIEVDTSQRYLPN